MKHVVRLMNGLEKRYDDCFAHALLLRENKTYAVVITDDGVTHHWPSQWVVDDANEEERAEFYVALNKTRSQQAAEYRRDKK